MQQSKVWSCSVLTPSTRSPRSPCLTRPRQHRAAALRVATTTARVITSRKHVSLRVCLFIPTGRVLVCVYGQEIPPRSLSQNPPMLAGLAFCRVLSPCTPALFPCQSPAPEANLRDVTHATSAPSCLPGIPNTTAGNLGPRFLYSVGPSVAHVQEGASLNKGSLGGSSLHLCKTSVPEGTGFSVGMLVGALSCLFLHTIFLAVASRVQDSLQSFPALMSEPQTPPSVHFPVWIICGRRKPGEVSPCEHRTDLQPGRPIVFLSFWQRASVISRYHF